MGGGTPPRATPGDRPVKRVALGFRAHSGWAAMVAIAAAAKRGAPPEVIFRRHIELVDPKIRSGVQPYHAARSLKLPAAKELIERATEATCKMALASLREIIEEIEAQGRKVAEIGIVLASGRPLPSLEATLRSHAMVHTAEGELFRGAISHAGEMCGLRVTGVKERELYEYAATSLKIPAAKLKTRVEEMGKSVGSPWTADEKQATLVAWMSLAAGTN
jgi:hypothetical protein